jgi:DNA-directed RNA polymerase specialized sigma24 family protein
MESDFARQVVVSEYARKLIRFKAQQLCRRADFSRSDREDIQQELTLYLFTRARSFDPGRASLNTFITCVINSGVRMLIRERSRLCRTADCDVQSLAEPAECDGRRQKPLAETVSPDDLGRRTGFVSEDPTVTAERTEAVRCVLKQLPRGVRDVCRALSYGSISSAVRDLNMPRKKIRKAIEAAKESFQENHFDEIR